MKGSLSSQSHKRKAVIIITVLNESIIIKQCFSHNPISGSTSSGTEEGLHDFSIIFLKKRSNEIFKNRKNLTSSFFQTKGVPQELQVLILVDLLSFLYSLIGATQCFCWTKIVSRICYEFWLVVSPWTWLSHILCMTHCNYAKLRRRFNNATGVSAAYYFLMFLL